MTDNVIPRPAKLPPGVERPLALRVATIALTEADVAAGRQQRWFPEFHYPVTPKGPLWAPGNPQYSDDYGTEAEAAEVVDWLARGWRRPVEATVIHPANRPANFRVSQLNEQTGGAA